MKKICMFLCSAVILTLLSGVNAEAIDYKFNMSYIYFGSSAGYTKLVDATRDSLSEVAPNYFSFDDFGNLVITNAADKNFVDEMHLRGIRVVPYLANDWANPEPSVTAITDTIKRAELVSALSAAVDQYGLDGINIDLENLSGNERDDYVEFVRLLYGQLGPKGKTVTVAVAANPWGHSNGWQGSYDYARLAAYCDYLMVMAYDEFPNGTKPGCVASFSFAEKSVQYALSQVPKEKIVLGLPFYGRIWADSGSYPQGYGVSNSKVDQLVATYGGSVFFDSASRSARATITVKPSDTKPVIGGKALSAGTYTIWYENEQSVKEKLALVQKYDLKGAGSWSLGQEGSGTWNYYKLWLNGCTFSDIQNSWAKDYILNAYKNNWVKGTSADSFTPDASLSRAEAAAMLVRMLGLPVASGSGASFTDTKGHWAEAYINTAKRYNIISGIGSNQFEPDKSITRQEIAVMLNNYFSYTATEQQTPFNDVSSLKNPWSYTAICALSENKIITGYPDGRYGPQINVTRAEMTALLSRINKA